MNADYSKLSDAELSVMVAERVANKLECDQWKPFNSLSMMKGDCGHADCIPKGMKIFYATSAAAVLPLIGDRLFSATNAQQRNPGDPREWQIDLWSYRGVGPYKGKNASFPRACCLALLAAHAGTQPPDAGTTAATKRDAK